MAELWHVYSRRIGQIKPFYKLHKRFSGWGSRFDVIEGPNGYVSMSPNGDYLDVVVDIRDKRVQERTILLLQDPAQNITNDGECNFRLDLSADLLSLELIGLRPSRK